MANRKIFKRGQIVEIDDPNIDTPEEAQAKHTQEKAAKDAKEAHRKDLVKHLQKVAKNQEPFDPARLAEAVLLALGEMP